MLQQKQERDFFLVMNESKLKNMPVLVGYPFMIRKLISLLFFRPLYFMVYAVSKKVSLGRFQRSITFIAFPKKYQFDRFQKSINCDHFQKSIILAIHKKVSIWGFSDKSKDVKNAKGKPTKGKRQLIIFVD